MLFVVNITRDRLLFVDISLVFNERRSFDKKVLETKNIVIQRY